MRILSNSTLDHFLTPFLDSKWESIWLLRPQLVLIMAGLLALIASAHAIIYKRDSRAAVAWVGLIWLSPFIGAGLYYILGINRIKRKALLARRGLGLPPQQLRPLLQQHHQQQQLLQLQMPHRLQKLHFFINKVVALPVLPGNRIQVLQDGEQAYPAMLEAIAQARSSLTLSTYIFDNDDTGKEFAQALCCARQRGVDIRVLIDDVGARYSFPPITFTLRRHKIPYARFMPTGLPWRMAYINLRNHRKCLVVDGTTAFTGGMNIRNGHYVQRSSLRNAISDVQFKLQGPIVGQMQEIFQQDWFFAAKEILSGPRWFSATMDLHPEEKGHLAARCIADGPDENFEKTWWTLCGAISMAKKSLQIVTPYFLPDTTLLNSLMVAAMAGVEVQILLPAHNNLQLVQWASQSLYLRLLQGGCRIYLSPGPFDHSKFFIVDGLWSLIGSSNWDTRSLRLNFEMNLECYGADLALELQQIFARKCDLAQELSLQEVLKQSLLARLRDGSARLLSPYL